MARKKTGVLVTYDSNNSGGRWWLSDEDWKKLETAGWDVEWGGAYFCRDGNFGLFRRPLGKPILCKDVDKCPGHRCYDSLEEVKAAGGRARWLGAASRKASKVFPSLEEGIHEWETLLGKDASDEGCNCCGAPHSFRTESPHRYVSGEGIVAVLYPGSPPTLRQAAEQLAKRKRKTT